MSKRCRSRFFRRAILLLLSVAALTAAACTSDMPAPSSATPSPTAGGEATAQPPATATPATPADAGGGAPAHGPDTDALAAVYNALDGANWDVDTNWLSDAPLGEWHGVTTDETGRVTGLDLSGNSVGGSFPDEIAKLTGLRVLNLSDNGIRWHGVGSSVRADGA